MAYLYLKLSTIFINYNLFNKFHSFLTHKCAWEYLCFIMLYVSRDLTFKCYFRYLFSKYCQWGENEKVLHSYYLQKALFET